MPFAAIGRALFIFLSYLVVAVAFTWPLPLHLSTLLPGPPDGDTGAYVWNAWAFSRAVGNGTSPFVTPLLAAATGAPVPLVLHNYTAFTNLLGLPLVGPIGVVATYNVLVLISHALSASAMYLLAMYVSRDRAAAWMAGLLFGFAPFAIARSMGHFSLIQTAPLPVFVWLLLRLADGRSWRNAAGVGAVTAWAYYCDPYYAVYCAIIVVAALTYASVTISRGSTRTPRSTVRALDVAIAALVATSGAIAISGGGVIELGDVRISMRTLYTPMLILTALVLTRITLTFRPRAAFSLPPPALDWRNWVACGVAGLLVGAPVVIALGSGHATLMGPDVLWRSSAPGVDLAAMFLPNPWHPLAPEAARAWLWNLPQGLVENVASIPWTAIGLIVAAGVIWRLAIPRGWLLWTIGFALIAMGPFVRVVGYNLAIPGPWALLRYLPIVGAARVPTRFSVLVVLGVAVMAAVMLAAVRRRATRPALVAATVAALALFELLPVPRTLYAADVPAFVTAIHDDPRPLAVLNVPFGLRDGLASYGRFSPLAMLHQTFHGKPLMGGYVSRLPDDALSRGAFAESPVPHTLLALSSDLPVAADAAAAFERDGRTFIAREGIGWVVVDRVAASPSLERRIVDAFGLRLTTVDGRFALYEPESR